MDIRQVANKNKYDLVASSYDFVAFLLSLGQASRLYDEVANRLDLPEGGTVVELGCGPRLRSAKHFRKIRRINRDNWH